MVKSKYCIDVLGTQGMYWMYSTVVHYLLTLVFRKSSWRQLVMMDHKMQAAISEPHFKGPAVDYTECFTIFYSTGGAVKQRQVPSR